MERHGLTAGGPRSECLRSSRATSPVTERIAVATLAFPFSSRLSDEKIHYVARALVEGAR